MNMRYANKMTPLMVAAAMLCSATSASAAVTFQAATLNVLGLFGSAPVGFASQAAVPLGAPTILSRSAARGISSASIVTSGQINNPTSGEFISNSMTNVTVPNGSILFDDARTIWSFRYRFSLTTDSYITIDYNINDFGNFIADGGGGFGIYEFSTNNIVFYRNLGKTAAGTERYNLLGGHEYVLSLGGFSGDSINSFGTQSVSGYAHEHYNFLITDGSLPAVPEPATWAMMLTGFTIVAGAARRRRSVAAV